MTIRSIVLTLSVCVVSAGPLFAQNKDAHAKAKEDILAAEAAFCALAKEQGLEAAFGAFAADDAVVCRTTKVYLGKEGIKEYFSRKDKNDKLIWKPSFVDASEAGDMGYTYGEYDFEGVRAGKTITDHGTFHTIWKKQKDGRWKFVLD